MDKQKSSTQEALKIEVSTCGKFARFRNKAGLLKYKAFCEKGHLKDRKNTRECSYCKESETLFRTLQYYWELPSVKNKHASWKNCHVRVLARDWYAKSSVRRACLNCGYDKHIEICHIKPVSDFPGSATIFEVNNPENILTLCPNCHWEFDHQMLSIESIPKLDLTVEDFYKLTIKSYDDSRYEVVGEYEHGVINYKNGINPRKKVDENGQKIKRKRVSKYIKKGYTRKPSKYPTDPFVLFDLVWKIPAVSLSKEYGVSDVAIGKFCKKNKIPKPSPGYWAMLDGQKERIYNEAKIEFEKVHGSIDSSS